MFYNYNMNPMEKIKELLRVKPSVSELMEKKINIEYKKQGEGEGEREGEGEGEREGEGE